jgi:polysaccharide biosynthesis transport protein
MSDMADDTSSPNARPVQVPAPAVAAHGASSAYNSAYTAYGAGYGDAGDAHLSAYVRILYKRRWIAIAAFLVVFGSVMVYAFTATPLYEAKAQLLIESDNPNVVKFEEVLNQDKTTDDYYQTQYGILRSRALVRKTLDSQKLWDHAVFTSPRATFTLNPITLTSRASSWVTSLFAAPAASAAPSETEAQARKIDQFLGRLSVVPVRNSRLVDVRVESPDPQFAMKATNGLAAAYIEQNLEFRFTATKEASDFLTQRMSEQQQALQESELALQQYREQTDSVSLEDRQNIVVQRLNDLNAAVTRARTERIEKEAAWNRIRTIQNDRAALDTHPLVLSNAFIQQLKGELAQLEQQQAQLAERLGDLHPDMVKVKSAISSGQLKLQTEIAKVVQSIRNNFQTAQEQERTLTAALAQQEQLALGLNRQSIEYGALQRNATSNRQILDGLLQRSKETGISGELRAGNIRVVDQAELPRRPSSPNKRNFFLIGIFAGTLISVGLAFFFEYLDGRIKAPEEIKAHLGLPFLGMIPELRPKELASGTLLSGSVPQNFAEAFRSIRTNVLFASAEAGSKTVVVTSTVPGEGKTLVSANMALSLAMAGQRVLLVDADLRRPKVHDIFEASQEPGLSNLLVGAVAPSQAIQHTSTQNLWLLTAGKSPPNPAELLGSKRFSEFLNSLKDLFDWVIIDSPPVMAVTDASVVSHVATGVVFVVGAEMIGRSTAKAALEQLDGAKARYVGAILNRVDLTRHPYYYSRYYKREYSSRYYATPA